MTLEQWIGVWVIVAGMLIGAGTAIGVTLSLYVWLLKQDERRYGVRCRWSRPEAGSGWRGPAVDGPTDRQALARVGWVGIERVHD